MLCLRSRLRLRLFAAAGSLPDVPKYFHGAGCLEALGEDASTVLTLGARLIQGVRSVYQFGGTHWMNWEAFATTDYVMEAGVFW